MMRAAGTPTAPEIEANVLHEDSSPTNATALDAIARVLRSVTEGIKQSVPNADRIAVLHANLCQRVVKFPEWVPLRFS